MSHLWFRYPEIAALTAVPAEAPKGRKLIFDRLSAFQTDCRDLDDSPATEIPGFALLNGRGRQFGPCGPATAVIPSDGQIVRRS